MLNTLEVQLRPLSTTLFSFWFFFIEEYQFRRLSFLENFNFWTALFSKMVPNFWRSVWTKAMKSYLWCEHLWKSNQKIIFILLICLLKSTSCWLTSPKPHHWGHTNIAQSRTYIQWLWLYLYCSHAKDFQSFIFIGFLKVVFNFSVRNFL